MIKKIIQGFIFFFISVCSVTAVANSPLLNTTNEIPVPSERYPLLYTIHAKNATLLHHKNQTSSEASYQLVLHQVHPRISYVFADLSEQGTQSTSDFIQLWKQQNVRADVTGIQVDHHTIGHTQFYTKALLSHPIYHAQRKELVFDLIPVKEPIHMEKIAFFDNATLFINGCTLTECKKKIRS